MFSISFHKFTYVHQSIVANQRKKPEIKLNRQTNNRIKKKTVPGNAENAWMHCVVVSEERHVVFGYNK